MAKRKVESKADMMEISGVGEARVKNYGDAVLGIMAGAPTGFQVAGEGNEKNGKSLLQNR